MSDVTARAAHAERLMNDEVLKEAFAAVVNEMVAEWVSSPIDAADKRESYYRNIVAVDRVRGKLKSFMDDGKLAAAAIKRAQDVSR